MKLKLLELIKKHPNDYRDILTEKPYCLAIREDDDYILFKYNQIQSDFNLQIVREARGIIFDKNTWEVVCRAFDKFMNHGQVQADKIDWSTAKVLQKLDGSIIKFFYHNNEWHIATNGTINAQEADLQLPFKNSYGDKINSFGLLVVHTLQEMLGGNIQIASMFSELDKNYTHIGELCTPYNRVVVPHKDCKLYYLSSRNNKTGQEKHFKDLENYLPIPETYPLTSLEECIESAKKLPFNEEGYVVVDSKYHRNKIKSSAYLTVAHLHNNGNLSHKRILNLILIGEHKEYLSYFPEYTYIFNEFSKKYYDIVYQLQANVKEYTSNYSKVDRKTLAQWAIKECPIPAFIFSYADGKVQDVDEFIHSMRLEYILSLLE